MKRVAYLVGGSVLFILGLAACSSDATSTPSTGVGAGGDSGTAGTSTAGGAGGSAGSGTPGGGGDAGTTSAPGAGGMMQGAGGMGPPGAGGNGQAGTNPFGGPGAGGSDPAGGPGAGGGGPGGGPGAGGSGPAQDCGTCIGDKCSAEGAACQGDPACGAIITCANMCTDAACQQACVDGNPAGAAAFNTLLTCVGANCATECGGGGGGTGGSGGAVKCTQIDLGDMGGPCSTCGHTSCCGELEACFNDADCNKVNGCLVACKGDQMCQQGCVNAPGGDLFLASNSCISKNCMKECQLADGCLTLGPESPRSTGWRASGPIAGPLPRGIDGPGHTVPPATPGWPTEAGAGATCP
jgi:hypothetical protein